MKKGYAKNCVGILRFIRMPFLIFENGISKRAVPAILKFVSTLFLAFKKGDQEKVCARYLKIRKYSLF